VVGCAAPGGKQEAGAIIGALVGGIIGNQVGGRNASGETVVGAVAGAAAGSAIGCEMQKDRPRARSAVYSHDGQRLRGDVLAADYVRIGDTFVAETRVNVRAAPTADSARIDRLRAGERFQALARVRGTDWILVGRNGVGVGYVRDDYVRPAGRRYAAY
jgi:uncharacterized protein YgiM (DUF1202 family)